MNEKRRCLGWRLANRQIVVAHDHVEAASEPLLSRNLIRYACMSSEAVEQASRERLDTRQKERRPAHARVVPRNEIQCKNSWF